MFPRVEDAYEARAGAFSALAALAAFPVGYTWAVARVLGRPKVLNVGLLRAVVSMGNVVGAGAVVARGGGRRAAMVASSVAFVAGAVAAAAASRVWTFFTGLFVAAVGAGAGLPASVAYIAEVAPRATRGQFVSLAEVAVASGGALATAAGLLVEVFPGRHTWRAVVLIGTIPSLILLWAVVCDHTIPASPRWLALSPRGDLEQGRPPDDRDDDRDDQDFDDDRDFDDEKDDEGASKVSDGGEVRAAFEMLAVSEADAETWLAEVRAAPAAPPALRRRCVLLAVVAVCARSLSGAEVLQTEMPFFLRDRVSRGDGDLAVARENVAAVVFATGRAMTAGCVALGALFDRAGRVRPMVASAAATTAALVVFAAVAGLRGSSEEGPAAAYAGVVVVVALYVLAAEGGIFPGSFVLASEVLDNATRLRGLALATAIDGVLAAILQAIAEPIVRLAGWAAFFAILATLAALVAAAFVGLLPETNNVTLEDVPDHIGDLFERRADYLAALAEDISDSVENFAFRAYDALADLAARAVATTTTTPPSTTSADEAAPPESYGSVDLIRGGQENPLFSGPSALDRAD